MPGRFHLAREVNGLIEEGEGSSSSDEFRQAALTRILRIVGADDGFFLAYTPDLLTRAPSLLREYSGSTVYQQNLTRARQFAAQRDGAFVDSAVYSRSEREALPIFRESLRPARVNSLLAWSASFRGVPSGIVHVYRRGAGREFLVEDLDRVRPVLRVIAGLHASIEPRLVRLPPPEGERLAPREVEVAALVARGYANLQIAMRLGVSAHTVRHQLEAIFRKLRVGNRTELAQRLRDAPALAPTAEDRALWPMLRQVTWGRAGGPR